MALVKSTSPSICEQHNKKKAHRLQGGCPFGDECRLSQNKSHIANRWRLRSMILPMPQGKSFKKITMKNNPLKNIK